MKLIIATKTTKVFATKARRHEARNPSCLRAFVAKPPCSSWLIIFVFFVAHAAAQEPVRLTLEDAHTRSQQASHRLAEIRAREQAAQATVAIRDAASKPNVALLGGYTRTNHVQEFIVPSPAGVPRVLYPDVPDNYRARLDLQWPIYTGGRTDALERAARAEAAALSAEVEVARADLRLEVARAFWALVTARASVGVLEQAVERAQAHVREARERRAAGLTPPNEVASAEAQESRQRMLAIEARNLRDGASSDLARLIGADLLQPIEPVETLELTPAVRAEIDQLAAEARGSRSERLVLERRIEASEERQAVAAAAALPTISIGGGYDYARPNPRIFPRADRWDDSWDASINVSWSLWDGGRMKAEIAEASSLTSAARQRLEEFDSVLALDVRQRVLDLASGRAAVEAADDAVRSAAEARRVTAERYTAGVATYTEVLDAQVALLQAELDRTRALANVRLAEARLARAVGQ